MSVLFQQHQRDHVCRAVLLGRFVPVSKQIKKEKMRKRGGDGATLCRMDIVYLYRETKGGISNVFKTMDNGILPWFLCVFWFLNHYTCG